MSSPPYIKSIEQALQKQMPNLWQRLDSLDGLDKLPLAVCAGWKVKLPNGFVSCPYVSFLLVVIDMQFPLSQPRIIAPEAFRDFNWPHVEPGGLLCLKTTYSNGDAGERVMAHIKWAQELLSIPEKNHRQEFELEFSSYWNQKKSKPLPSCNSILSLVKTDGISRIVVWFHDLNKRRIIVADDYEKLIAWLRNTGLNPSLKEIIPTWLEWLPRPWIPSEFPENGTQVLNYIPSDVADSVIKPRNLFPVFFGAETVSGIVFSAIILQGVNAKEITKGFRNISRVPKNIIRNSYSAKPVLRYPVERVDGKWIHGRDHNSQYPYLSKQRVAIIGCGALGASIARLLCESGLKEFILVDHDSLKSANISRHALGLEFLGTNKALATAMMLMKSFPHINQPDVFKQKFEDLAPKQLDKIADCELILSCGITYEGDIKIDTWRQSLKTPPAHVCCWTEEFAIVGHAMALIGKDSLQKAFDKEEKVKFRLTEWPPECEVSIIEAGCGNVFQPFGAIDLQATINLSAGLALDVISNKSPKSKRQVWLGNRDEVVTRGGNLHPLFTDSLCIKEYPW